jgi:glycosyltransferase involved in cell wall biosynthesis
MVEGLATAQLIETLNMGGAERLAVQIANARAEQGDRSHLLVMGGPGPLSAEIDPRVHVRYFEFVRAPIGRPFAFAASIRRGYRLLAGTIAERGIEVVQTHLPGANFWGLVLAWRGRCAVAATVHNNREFDYGDADHPVRARLRRWAYRRMLRRCGAVIAVSEKVRRSFAQDVAADGRELDRLVAIPNGVAEPVPLDAAARAAVRDRFGCRGDEPLLLTAGRHTAQKHLSALIEAAARLRDRGVACRTVLLGDGELRAQHARRVAELELDDRVVLPGNAPDFPRLVQAADVFVLPSLWEGLPLVLLEAMAAGTCCVGSDIPGIRDLLSHDETGLLAAPDDPDALADVLERCCAEPATRTRLGTAGRERVRRDYSFTRVVRDLGDLYSRIRPQPPVERTS